MAELERFGRDFGTAQRWTGMEICIPAESEHETLKSEKSSRDSQTALALFNVQYTTLFFAINLTVGLIFPRKTSIFPPFYIHIRNNEHVHLQHWTHVILPGVFAHDYLAYKKLKALFLSHFGQRFFI